MITLKEAAVLRIKQMMNDYEDSTSMIRFGVVGGGCSGLSYTIGFEKQKKEDDEFFVFDGIEVLVNQKDYPLVKGTVIDYKQNLMGGGFTIDNPNAIITCGCGSSFRTKTEKGTITDC